jgi:triphosphoribosyl-dephospho-CoA synthase
MKAGSLARHTPFAPSCSIIGRAAVRALYAEIALYPKPGLVSPRDSGAHQDMDFSTFLRSLFALRSYFPAMAQAGAEEMPFSALQVIGLAAEARMMQATGGINTHRGAIFSLGLLAAAAGALRPGASAASLAGHVARAWGAGILGSAPATASSHGLAASRSYGIRGAREEAAEGFPILIQHALPSLKACLSAGADAEAAAVQSLFVIITQLDDTNLLHRGGPAGLDFAQRSAQDFLDRGGIFAPGWYERAQDLHHAFVARRLSPGGAADMLAATLFLHAQETAA